MADTDSSSDSGALDLGKRIRIMEARAAIADLVHRYALNIRRRQPDQCGALFTDDGQFEIRDADPAGEPGFTTRAHAIGRAAVVDYVMGSMRSGFHVFPMIRNLLIDVDGSTTASASSLMNSRTWPSGVETFGEYQDSFREENGVWLFTGRIFTIYKRPA